MTSKLHNLLPIEAYTSYSNFLLDAPLYFATYGLGLWLFRDWDSPSHRDLSSILFQ